AKAVFKQLPEKARKYNYLFLQAPWVYYYYKLTNPSYKGALRSEFRFTPVPKAEVQRVFYSSRSILDIEHPNQSGLTMRTFETLGCAKKLITTNSKVSQYDFYMPENISIIERHNPVIPDNFFSTNYKPLSPSLYQKYSLEGWLDEILLNLEK
ncbi:MAG: capsular biosynthesis protein CpsH, partial [bacterium]